MQPSLLSISADNRAPAFADCALVRLPARLAALEDAVEPDNDERRRKAGGLLPEDIRDDLGRGPHLDWFEQRRAEEAMARCREDEAPTIDHKPVVTLYDPLTGIEEVITQPLPESRRYRPTSRIDQWNAWRGKGDAVKAKMDIDIVVRALDKIVVEVKKEFKQIDKAVKKAAADEKAAADGEKPKRKRIETPEQKRGREVSMQNAACKANREQRARGKVAGRLDKFSLVKPKIIADRTYLTFEEAFRNAQGKGTALRSQLGIVGLELYNARLPKQCWFGRDKREVFDGSCLQRVFLLDEPYLVIAWWKVRSQLVVDLDRKWNTLAELRADIARKIGARLMPTLIPHRLDKDGRIDGAHLMWVLPPGSEVGIGGKSLTGPIRMFNMVQDALIAALQDIGADPGHENTAKTKNPLAPAFSVACCENFPTLQDFVDALPTVSVTRTEMKRRHRAMREAAGMEVSQSAYEWNTVRDIIRRLIQTAMHERDQEFVSALRAVSTPAYGEWLREKLLPEVRAALCIPPGQEFSDQLKSILHKQIRWRCSHRPSPNTRGYYGANRGRDRHLYTSYAYKGHGLVGAATAEDRRFQGLARKILAGEVTRANQREATIQMLIDQAQLFARIGGDVDDAAALTHFIILSGKRARSTVYNRINKGALARVQDASRYIAVGTTVKKPSPSIPVEQPAAPAVVVQTAPVDRVRPVVVESGTFVDLAEPPSSSQSSVRRRVAEPPVTGGTVRTSTCPSRPSTWLQCDGPPGHRSRTRAQHPVDVWPVVVSRVTEPA